VGAIPFLFQGEAFELRLASVRANGEPWHALDELGWPGSRDASSATLDWPYPEPGPNMADDPSGRGFRWPSSDPPKIASSDVVPADLPGPTASWSEVSWFAARFDGYERLGFDELAALGNGSADEFASTGLIDPELSVDQLRACLFFEYRRSHHLRHVPGAESSAYIRALVDAIRVAVAG
jgi:hypothetical protein